MKKMVEVETLLAGAGGIVENKDHLITSVWWVFLKETEFENISL